MAEFRYTSNGDFDPNDSEIGYQASVNAEARTLDFGPGASIDGYQGYGNYLVYLLNGPGIEYESSVFPLTTQEAGLYGDSSDFDNVTRVTGGDFGDVFRTGDGDDVLNGGGGNDVLEGGRGKNTFNGGAGTNTLSYEHFDAPNQNDFFGVGIDMLDGTAGDSTGDIVFDSFSNIANIRGSQYNDSINGNTDNNVIEGGAGTDFLNGGDGIDTLSYEHSSGGVRIDLGGRTASGGDAEGDDYTGFENVLGSTSADILFGTSGANTLNGNGGNDELYGANGDDRLVIGNSPAMVDGGNGMDLLFIANDSTVEFTDVIFSNFRNIEKVYVRDGASLTMTGLDVGTKIFSQSVDGGEATILGTEGADRIQAGKGNDTLLGGGGDDDLVIGSSPVMVQGNEGTDRLFITKNSIVELTGDSFTATASIERIYVRDGAHLTMTGVDVGAKIFSQSLGDGEATIVGTDGADRIQAGRGADVVAGGLGGDSLLAGAGGDIFVFASGDGRDVIRKFDVAHDNIALGTLADRMEDLTIKSFHGAANTIITFGGDSNPSDKIILLGVTADSLTVDNFIL